MQKYFTLATISAFCILAFAACKKPFVSNTKFEVTGVQNMSLAENGGAAMALEVNQISGEAELVTLSVSGLPEGVSVGFNPATAMPGFRSTMQLKDDSSAGGTYNITLTARAAHGREQQYKFTLTTLDKTCAKKLAGTYHCTYYRRTGTGGILDNFTFYEDPTDKDKLLFRWNDHDAELVVNCNKNRLTIPYQDVGKFKIIGNGFFEDNYQVIDFDYMERHDNGDTISCAAHFIRK